MLLLVPKAKAFIAVQPAATSYGLRQGLVTRPKAAKPDAAENK
jgi:hypothetical protein